jgi:hypothetical protein
MGYLAKNKGWLVVFVSLLLTSFSFSAFKKGDSPVILFHSETANDLSTKQPPDPEIKKAVKLFRNRKYKDAFPILEKLALETPKDDQAVLGLGVTSMICAYTEADPQLRDSYIAHARNSFNAAKNLGIDNFDDFISGNDLQNLSTPDSEDTKNIIERFLILWGMHPQPIFDNDPPKGIMLLDGYRHKNSTDFEGMTGGTIWKPKGLKINYEFDGQFQGEGYKNIPEAEWMWLREKTVFKHKFKYILTWKNELVVTAYVNNSPPLTDYHPIADFYCDVYSERDIETVLTIITGLKEKRF